MTFRPLDIVPCDAAELVAYINARGGQVCEEAALRFADKVMYGAVSEEHFASMDPVTKAHLYMVVSNYARGREIDERFIKMGEEPPLLGCLGELNRHMGLTEDFYRRQAAEAELFFDPGMLMTLDTAWKRSGNPTENFSAALYEQIHEFPSLQSARTQEMIRFIAREFCELHGRPCPEIVFADEAPNSCGAHGFREDGTEYVMLNVNAEKFDQLGFLGMLDTLSHELKHAQQDALGLRFLRGEIDEDDPDYAAAAVFAANLKTARGYQPPQGRLGFEAYKEQPAEVDARYFGHMFAHLALKTYGGGKIPQRRRDPLSPAFGHAHGPAGAAVTAYVQPPELAVC